MKASHSPRPPASAAPSLPEPLPRHPPRNPEDVGSPEPLLEQLSSRQLLAAGLGLGGALLLAAYWGVYLGTPATQPCPDGSGTCPADLPALMATPAVLMAFAAGYASLVGALLLALPSRLLAGLVAVGAAGWALPALLQAWNGTYGEIDVGFFVTFLIGAAAHVTMPGVALRSLQRTRRLTLYPVLVMGAAGLVLLVAAGLLGRAAPAPLAGALVSFWGFGLAAAAVAIRPWKLPR